MTIRTLFVNISSTGSQTLDTNISTCSEDSIILAEILKNNGREVWLLPPYKIKSKQSSWPNQTAYNFYDFNQFDEVFIFIKDLHFHCCSGRSVSLISKNIRTQMILRGLDSFHGKLYNVSYDPKAGASTFYKSTDIPSKLTKVNPARGSQEFMDILVRLVDRAIPVSSMRGMLLDTGRTSYFADTGAQAHRFLGRELQRPERSREHTTDVLYTGIVLNDYRRVRLNYLLSSDKIHSTILGPAVKHLKKVKVFSHSNSDILKSDENFKAHTLARFSLIISDAQHTDITHRVYIACLFGSIPLIDSDSKLCFFFRNLGLNEHIVSSPEDIERWIEKRDDELDEAYRIVYKRVKELNDDVYTFAELRHKETT